MFEASDSDFDMEDSNTDFFVVGKKVRIDLADLDYKTWGNELQQDADKKFEFKVLLNDSAWETGYNHSVQLGNIIEISPNF